MLMASRTECGVDEFPAASVAVISNWYESFNSASGEASIETSPVVGSMLKLSASVPEIA
eukprot:COSAG01_NODE_76013_length_191_cov_16.706522_1_plen_58_part_10